MSIDMIQVALWGFFLMVLISYVVGSGIMIYHIVTFGLNRRTAITSSIVYLVSSGIILALMLYQLVYISLSFSLPV